MIIVTYWQKACITLGKTVSYYFLHEGLIFSCVFQEVSDSNTILVSSGSDAGAEVTASSDLLGVTKIGHLSS